MKANRRTLRKLRHSLAAAPLLVALGSCTGPSAVIPPAPPPPPPRLHYQPTQPAVQNWQDMPITPGDWRWSNDAGQSTARFGTPGAPVLTLTCRADRAVVLTRSGTPPAATATATVILHAGSLERPLTAQAQPAGVALALNARDPLLDAIAFARGRFAVEVQGMPTLALPSWPEVARVIDDCR